MISCNCERCGKFSSVYVDEERNRSRDIIYYCKKCDVLFGRSISYYLAVHGELEPHVSIIFENSIRWKELMDKKE